MNWYIPDMGYQENFLPAEQKKLGHEVFIIASDRHPIFPGLNDENRFVGTDEFEDKGVKIYRLPVLYEYKPSGQLIFKGLKALLKRLKPDVVHSHGAFNTITLQVIHYKKKFNYKLFIDDHSHDNNFNVDNLIKKGYINFFIFYCNIHKKRIQCLLPVQYSSLNILNKNIPNINKELLQLGANDNIFKPESTLINKIRENYQVNINDILLITSGKFNKKKDIDILIIKYLENKSTEEERRQILQFLKSGDSAGSSKEVLFSLLGEFQEAGYESHPVDFERIFNEIEAEILDRETKESEKQVLQKRRIVKRWILQGISVAAIFCIAFFLGTLFNRQNNEIIPVQPGQSITYNEIKAPLGARSEIRLIDGTEIILNAGSSIKYRSDYNLLDRDLILEGEAYFKVASNIDIPLVVFAGDINIKATGTEFNVKAYSDEGIIETTLVTGEVEISQKGNKDKERILVLKP
ncbi:MAG: hypothetical protein EHJ95_04855, partial [Methanobacteriota archaeon]